jgi:tRNA-dihydrouridine synthase
MNFWNTLPKPFFVLAPMDDVTDIVFRDVVENVSSPDVFMTEFVSTDGLDSPGRNRVIEKLRFNPQSPTPLVAQIWGKDPDKYFKAARDIVQLGGFTGIDINMGCPEKGIVARGCCGGLIGNFEDSKAIIEATKAGAGSLPVSVKSRIGLNTIITEEWYGFLLQQGLSAVTVHARTVKEMSKVPAHWDEIKRVVELRNQLAPNTLVIGNGDVRNRHHGLDLADESGVDGIMVGRGIFQDIFTFSDVTPDPNPDEMIRILLMHLDRYETEWGSDKSFQILKKFFKIYINGWPGSSALRAKLMETNDPSSVRELLSEAQRSSHLHSI